MAGSSISCFINGGCSSVGRVPDCDSGCRGFEPHQSPHFYLITALALVNFCKMKRCFCKIIAPLSTFLPLCGHTLLLESPRFCGLSTRWLFCHPRSNLSPL